MDWTTWASLLGDPEAEVRRVLVALDITEAVADEAIAENCQLIVSHHPVMNCKWLPVQTVPQDTPQGHLLLKILRAACPPSVCTRTWMWPRRRQRRAGRRAGAGGPWALGTRRGCAGWEHWQVLCLYRNLQSTSAGRSRPTASATPGTAARCGRSRWAAAPAANYEDAAIAAGCDVFVTSDLSYHQFLDAAGKGIRLIDAGHFPTENPVCTVLAEYLRGRFRASPSPNPPPTGRSSSIT